VEALNGPQEFLKGWRDVFQGRRDLVVRGLNANTGLDCLTPEGAFYVFPSVKRLLGKTSGGGRALTTDADFVLALLEGELHGYALMRRVDELSDGAVKMGPGTLYGTLNRLVTDVLADELAGILDVMRTRTGVGHWVGTVGILLYVAAMWVSGITQGLMLNATTEGGTVLAYPNFLDTLNSIRPLMALRIDSTITMPVITPRLYETVPMREASVVPFPAL
jgi:hypothetical protein